VFILRRNLLTLIIDFKVHVGVFLIVPFQMVNYCE
jgi:hypothetical protein